MERTTGTRCPSGGDKARGEGTRKSLGRYYTDPVIAGFIVSKLEAIAPDKTVLDPSCGDGELLASYAKALVSSMRAAGTSDDDAREAITSNVWGFDVDEVAVMACTARLVRDALGGEVRVLHVYTLDALDVDVGAAARDAHGIDDSIHANKYDYVIGNPPFFVVDKEKAPYRSVLGLDVYKAVDADNLNVASMFLHRYMHSLRPGGQLAFVFPRSLLHVNSFAGIRGEILGSRLQCVFDLGKAFDGVGLEQCIVVIKNAENRDNLVHYALLEKAGDTITEVISYDIPQAYLASTKGHVFEVFSGKKASWQVTWAALMAKIGERAAGNGIMRYCTGIQRGTGLQREASASRRSQGDILVRGGRSIFTFGKKGQETCRYLDERRVVKDKMPGKERANLYSPKVMLQNLVSSRIRIVGCYDDEVQRPGDGHEPPRYAMSFDTVTNLYLEDQRYARFLLAVLTSELVTCLLRDVVFVRATLTIHLDRQYLERIPVPHPTDVQLDSITAAVTALEIFAVEHQRREPTRERDVPAWENQVHPDHQIFKALVHLLDDLIYDLYGITSEERRFISSQLREFDSFY